MPVLKWEDRYGALRELGDLVKLKEQAEREAAYGRWLRRWVISARQTCFIDKAGLLLAKASAESVRESYLKRTTQLLLRGAEDRATDLVEIVQRPPSVYNFDPESKHLEEDHEIWTCIWHLLRGTPNGA